MNREKKVISGIPNYPPPKCTPSSSFTPQAFAHTPPSLGHPSLSSPATQSQRKASFLQAANQG